VPPDPTHPVQPRIDLSPIKKLDEMLKPVPLSPEAREHLRRFMNSMENQTKIGPIKLPKQLPPVPGGSGGAKDMGGYAGKVAAEIAKENKEGIANAIKRALPFSFVGKAVDFFVPPPKKLLEGPR